MRLRALPNPVSEPGRTGFGRQTDSELCWWGRAVVSPGRERGASTGITFTPSAHARQGCEPRAGLLHSSAGTSWSSSAFRARGSVLTAASRRPAQNGRAAAERLFRSGHQLTSDRREHRLPQRKPLHLGAGKPLSRGFPARRSVAPICGAEGPTAARCRCSRGLCGPNQTARALVERRGAAFRWEPGVPVFEVPGKPLSGSGIPAGGRSAGSARGLLAPRPR